MASALSNAEKAERYQRLAVAVATDYHAYQALMTMADECETLAEQERGGADEATRLTGGLDCDEENGGILRARGADSSPSPCGFSDQGDRA